MATVTASFSTDGRLAAIGCRDGSVRVFDVVQSLAKGKDIGTSTVLCKMMDIKAPVTAIAFHPNSKLLVAGSMVRFMCVCLRVWMSVCV